MSESMTVRRILFNSGSIRITRAAFEQLDENDVRKGLTRHLSGDWGDVCDEDRAENELSLREGFRLLSEYRDVNGIRFWVITEADRSSTTVLLPEDY